MKDQVKFLRHSLRDFGPGWLVRRAGYELQLRTGWHRLRFRQRAWDANELARWLGPDFAKDPLSWAAGWKKRRPAHFVDAAVNAPERAARLREMLGEQGVTALIAEADAALRGSFCYFSDQASPSRERVDWHRNPFTGQTVPAAAHWTRVPMFSPETGDLKFIWEPGRFGAAYLFVRAWAVSGDERYVEGFWQLVESWDEANPPHQGAHWKCGQETSLRLMAWAFALHAFANADATTPQRIARAVGMMAAQAQRVAADHIYSYLQTNNHSISEGVGLWTIGVLFPELRNAGAWRTLGRGILEEDALRLINPDGSFIQKSNNYHRLMLQDYLYAIRLAEVNGERFSEPLRERVRAAAAFIEGMIDESSGRAPNLGANDGALILPLNGCDYGDFRPVSEAARFLFQGTRRNESGPWHEDLFWLFGPDALQAARAKGPGIPLLTAPEGGCFTLRGRTSWALIRCPSFKDRPGHADALHIDLWRNGENVALDAGSYLYFAEKPWANGLATSLVHNTVTLDGLDQMERGPRFMWTEWLRSRVLRCERDPAGRTGHFEGEHDGYMRLRQPVTHRRAVAHAGDDVWVIVDDLIGQGTHEVRLHWLLADRPHELLPEGRGVRLNLHEGPYDLRVLLAAGDTSSLQLQVRRGDASSPLGGWQSLRYGSRTPAVSAAWTLRGPLPVRLISVFCPAQAVIDAPKGAGRLAVHTGDQRAEFALGAVAETPVVRHVQVDQLRARAHTFPIPA